MSELRDLVLEYDALVDEVAGYRVETEPPATAEELRAAERVLGCELHPDQVVYRSIHRSGACPVNTSIWPLPQRRRDVIVWPELEVLGLNPQQTLYVLNQPAAYSPQQGDRAGWIIEIEYPDPIPVLVASSLSELFSSWIAYIRAGLLEWRIDRVMAPEWGLGLGASREEAAEYLQRVHDLAGPGVRPAAIGCAENFGDGRSGEERDRALAAEAGFDYEELLDGYGNWDWFEESEARFSEW